MKIGDRVKPLTGFWQGFVGVIIEMPKNNTNYPFVVEFEENETNNYHIEQLVIA